jgi:nucleotide-binding universal stress UspA family protein
MGSVAEDVLRHADTPVLIVPMAALDALRTREGVQAA